MRHNQLLSLDESKKSSWPEIVTLLLALGTSLYASSIQHSWFAVVPILLTGLTAILLLKDIGIFSWILSSCRSIRARFAGNLAVRQNYIEFLRFVERAEVIKELMSELRNAKWSAEKTIFYVQNINSTSFENLYSEIVSSTKQVKVKKIREMELLGFRFRDFINTFNRYCLQLYSLGFKDGEVKYQNEDHRKRMVKLKRTYDKTIEEYSNFCKTLNYKARREILRPIYDVSPDLDWSKGLSQD